jgi:hypothetical protein
MKEIKATTVRVKLSDKYQDKTILVHDGNQIIELVEPGEGKVGVPPDKTMLAGTRREIKAEIKRLGLKEKLTRREKIDRRRAEIQAKRNIRKGKRNAFDKE